MQNPALKGTVIIILVLVSFISAFTTSPVFVHNTGIKPAGYLKPFSPDFTRWLENPGCGPINGEGDTHGLGLIPAPVSVVGLSGGDIPGDGKAGTGLLVIPTSLPDPAFSHPAAVSLI